MILFKPLMPNECQKLFWLFSSSISIWFMEPAWTAVAGFTICCFVAIWRSTKLVRKRLEINGLKMSVAYTGNAFVLWIEGFGGIKRCVAVNRHQRIFCWSFWKTGEVFAYARGSNYCDRAQFHLYFMELVAFCSYDCS